MEPNVKINNQSFYAQEVSMPQLLKFRRGIETKIEEGPSKWYFSPPVQRNFKMTLKLNGPHSESLDRIRPLFDKVVPFVMAGIATFDCLVDLDSSTGGAIEDGTPNQIVIHLIIQEVS